MCSQKAKSKQKSPGKEDENMPKNFGLLDAYTDSATPAAPCGQDDKVLAKKKKNQMRREKARQVSETKPEAEQESSSKPEVIESWEDLDDPVVESNQAPLPRTIEFPIKKAEIEDKMANLSLKEESKPKIEAKHGDLRPKMEDLKQTLSKIEALFNQSSNQSTSKIDNKDKKEVNEDQEKSKEDIKAEREAKKKAKALAKEQSKEVKETPKNTENVTENESKCQEKSKDDIKAEREAKKKAKALAREAAKAVKDGSEVKVNPIEAKPVEVDKSEGKSKAELKAERRAKQEAQRAKKAAEGQKKEVKVVEKVNRVPDEIQADRDTVEKRKAKRLASQQILPRTKAQRKVQLFSHLHQYEREFYMSR